jgi:cytochrome c oxidase cbb3-type subunit 4
MDINIFRGVITVALMGLFIALVVWAYGRARHDDFARLARLPLEDDTTPPHGKERR